MRRLVVLLVVMAAVVLGRSPTVAGACSCLDPGIDALVAQSDVVLLGTIVDQEPVDDPPSVNDAVRNTIEVERVYAGEADAEAVVLGGVSSSGSCEFGFEEGRYLVFGTVDVAGIHTDLCAGTRPLPAGEAVPADLGEGRSPTPLPPDVGPERADTVAAGGSSRSGSLQPVRR